MQAIILAAGLGRRLNGSTTPRPKCLYKVGGLALVEHQLSALAEVGIDDVVIVVGFQQDRVRQVVGSRVRCVVNERFALTNSLWSFLLARPLVDGDLLVMNSDVYFHPDMLGRLMQANRDALLYDSSSGREKEQMKVAVRGGSLSEMGKRLPRARTDGENVGMLRFTAATAEQLFDVGEMIVRNQGRRQWLAAAVNRISATREIHCIDVAGLPWVEIDFPDDLVRARTEVFPAVVGREIDIRDEHVPFASRSTLDAGHVKGVER